MNPYFHYSLEKKDYTYRNALLWGNCQKHFERAFQEKNWQERSVHSLIGAVELIPILGQIASLMEKYLALQFYFPQKKIDFYENCEKRVRQEAVTYLLSTETDSISEEAHALKEQIKKVFHFQQEHLLSTDPIHHHFYPHSFAIIQHLIEIELEFSEWIRSIPDCFAPLQKIAYLCLNHDKRLADKIYTSFTPFERMCFELELPNQPFLPESIRSQVFSFMPAPWDSYFGYTCFDNLWPELSLKEKAEIVSLISGGKIEKNLQNHLLQHPAIIGYDHQIIDFAKKSPLDFINYLFDKNGKNNTSSSIESNLDPTLLEKMNKKIKGASKEKFSFFIKSLIENLPEDSIVAIFCKAKYQLLHVWDKESVPYMRYSVGNRSWTKSKSFSILNFQGNLTEEEAISSLSFDTVFQLDQLEETPFWTQLWIQDRSHSFMFKVIDSEELQNNQEKSQLLLKSLSAKQIAKVLQKIPNASLLGQFGADPYSKEISLVLSTLWGKEKHHIKNPTTLNKLATFLCLSKAETDWLFQQFFLLQMHRDSDFLLQVFFTDCLDPFSEKKYEQSFIHQLLNHSKKETLRRSYLELLTLNPEETYPVETILRLFRKEALKYHPDKWSHLSEKELAEKTAIFQKLSAAKDFFSENPD